MPTEFPSDSSDSAEIVGDVTPPASDGGLSSADQVASTTDDPGSDTEDLAFET
jgi:hypothetical protein